MHARTPFVDNTFYTRPTRYIIIRSGGDTSADAEGMMCMPYYCCVRAHVRTRTASDRLEKFSSTPGSAAQICTPTADVIHAQIAGSSSGIAGELPEPFMTPFKQVMGGSRRTQQPQGRKIKKMCLVPAGVEDTPPTALAADLWCEDTKRGVIGDGLGMRRGCILGRNIAYAFQTCYALHCMSCLKSVSNNTTVATRGPKKRRRGERGQGSCCTNTRSN